MVILRTSLHFFSSLLVITFYLQETTPMCSLSHILMPFYKTGLEEGCLLHSRYDTVGS